MLSSLRAFLILFKFNGYLASPNVGPSFGKCLAVGMNSPNPYVQHRGQPRNRQTAKLVILLLLLALACLTCFGTAYYLFKTSYETRNLGLGRAIYADTPTYQVDVSTHVNGPRVVQSTERFLAYLPHSGFHNQRIAFENALVLARILGRTLIVPPIRLGNKPIPYYPFDRLSRQLALADKTGLKHCADVPSRLALPSECLDYYDSTLLPWNSLVDLTPVKTKQDLLPRWNFSEEWFSEELGITDDEEIRYFRDQTPYQYRLVDNGGGANDRTWYTEDIAIDFLAQQTQRLLVFGTLFGSTRLKLEVEAHQMIRKEIRQAMTIAHPVLDDISQSIFRALGGAYLAIHLRASETKFRKSSQVNAQALWWTLLHCWYNATADEILELEEQMQGTSTQPRTLSGTTYLSTPSARQCKPLDDVEKYALASASRSKCRQSTAHPSRLSVMGLNTPFLYIATDLNNSRHQPLLDRFRALFPCVVDISDFSQYLNPLDHTINPMDGVPLRTHLFPFLDALVAAKATRVVGTKGSTFSYYIEDVLWRRFHNVPIKQRG
ncbi:hypothetical protein NP233_g5709 [Leucocoprinus birnbaumii]|uniref:O-fucosyltransferase family protein n=1 Tax=Leucocoprinus birnbaumii TaxID=56174 RepID=A0AAD5YW81_9AGAR|nr:hypothetical protein NP233_g5709 [Leucocoprinus birnbaumii]